VDADNSIFAQIYDYRETIQQLALLGIVHTWYEEGVYLEHGPVDAGSGSGNSHGDNNSIVTTFSTRESSTNHAPWSHGRSNRCKCRGCVRSNRPANVRHSSAVDHMVKAYSRYCYCDVDDE
jgi:hypothetical protein